jgi:hypothetical protein
MNEAQKVCVVLDLETPPGPGILYLIVRPRARKAEEVINMQLLRQHASEVELTREFMIATLRGQENIKALLGDMPIYSCRHWIRDVMAEAPPPLFSIDPIEMSQCPLFVSKWRKRQKGVSAWNTVQSPSAGAKLYMEKCWSADYCDEQACILLPILELITLSEAEWVVGWNVRIEPRGALAEDFFLSLAVRVPLCSWQRIEERYNEKVISERSSIQFVPF